jgi:hypothetical protein
MAAPTNISAATATVLTVNATVTQDVSEAAPPLHEVWYTYGPATGSDVLMGWFATTTAGSTYVPGTSFFQGSPDALDPAFGFGGLAANPRQIQLEPGVTYYFRVRHAGADVPLDAPLALIFARAANLTAPQGTLAINDDTPGWPLVLLSAADGTVIQVRPFPAGETGTNLPTGESIWHDVEVVPGVIRLYDTALALRATAVWTFDGVSPPTTNNRSDLFYLGDPGGTFPAPTRLARVTTMTTSGAMGPTVWTLPEVGLRAIGVSRNDAVLYHTGQATGGSSIRRWDLDADTALSDLAATVLNYTPLKDILVLSDDTIVVAYATTLAPYDSLLRQYAPDGTLLHEHNLGVLQANRITWALDDPTTVWVWSFLRSGATLTGVSRFVRLRLSDGVALTSFENPRYEGGAYRPPTPTAPWTTFTFGHSPSCPFLLFPPELMVPPDLPPYVPPDAPPGPDPEPGPLPPDVAPSYDLDTRYIRRLRRAPHVANENKRTFYRTFELDLERGVGLATGQGSDPLVMLRLSRDGGHTWGEALLMSAGAMGAYTQRAVARRLGHARDVVFEVTVSDPVAWSLVQAWLDLEPGVH